MFTLTIETDNAAFEEVGAGHEIARILVELVARLKDGVTEGSLVDLDGNRVGRFELTP